MSLEGMNLPIADSESYPIRLAQIALGEARITANLEFLDGLAASAPVDHEELASKSAELVQRIMQANTYVRPISN